MHYVAPSILAADFAFLHRDISLVNQSQADFFHIDIMDGVFVPNISFGFPVLAAIKKYAEKPLDVHLMIEKPERYIEQFRAAGADTISVHIETCPHLHRTLQQIRQTGAKAGVALNPHTPVTQIFDILEDVDLVCLMSVNPGFGGQKFIYNTLQKIRTLKDEIISRNLSALIEIDGGVGLQNAQIILNAGADILVAGSSVFSTSNPLLAIEQLKAIETNML